MNDTATTTLDPKHFALLRIAKLRNLKVRAIGETVYAVTSFTRSGIEWVVTNGVCTCPARGYCSHLAMAVDAYFINAAGMEYARYNSAHTEDVGALRLRIFGG